MCNYISKKLFNKIFGNESLHLPVRHTKDYFIHLHGLLNNYISYINRSVKGESENYTELADRIKEICVRLKSALDCYQQGLPAKAYNKFAELMPELNKTPIKIYQKSVSGYDIVGRELNLYRAVKTDGKASLYPRERVFHAPYNLRSKVSSARYSIAGYPCLYLGTSLRLCCDEIQCDIKRDNAIASRFVWERDPEISHSDISVLEMAIKPQDFFPKKAGSSPVGRYFDEVDLNDGALRYRYMLWYPIIAASSYIRQNKNDPFAAEYIVPQLLMQWVREEAVCNENKVPRIIGIRYFSCASEKASDMGFNYVFPVSGSQVSKNIPYCKLLGRSFRLTRPHFGNKYKTYDKCERALLADSELKSITDL